MSEDKRLDEIIRVKKCRNNFVMMDKSFLEDLSAAVSGRVCQAIKKPLPRKVADRSRRTDY